MENRIFGFSMNVDLGYNSLEKMEVFIHLWIKLKTYDLVALTALQTLKEELGYKNILKDLEREEYWGVKVRVEDRKALDNLAKEFTTRVKIFVNPNKHSWRVETGDFSPERKPILKGEGKGVYQAEILTRWMEDQKEKLALFSLKKTWGYGEKIREVRRGILWRMKIQASGPEEVKKWIEEITVTRSLNQGLLINPHAEHFHILRIQKI